jgi:hypothetical protein
MAYFGNYYASATHVAEVGEGDWKSPRPKATLPENSLSR